MRKKIIVPVILLLLLGFVFIIGRSLPFTSSSGEKSVTDRSGTKMPKQTTASETPSKKGVGSSAETKLTIPNREPLILLDKSSVTLLQNDNTQKKYDLYQEFTMLQDAIQTKKWLYYCFDNIDSDLTLYRVPIEWQEDKELLLLQQKEQLGAVESSIELKFLYATDKFVVFETENEIKKLDVVTNKTTSVSFSEEDDDINWEPVRDYNGNPIIDTNTNLYVKQVNTATRKTTFYQLSLNTFKKKTLSDRTYAVLPDNSGEAVIMESDKTWNYAFYPETGKRYRCGKNMFHEWNKDTDYDELLNDTNNTVGPRTTTNQDLVTWIKENKPWSYQDFYSTNQFIYKDRMYVNVCFDWNDPDDIVKNDPDYSEDDYSGTSGNKLFSYSLKQYQGIRPETQINQTMEQHSEKNYEWVSEEDDEDYDYICTITGGFTLQLKNILVFEYKGNDQRYLLYDLNTGNYNVIDTENENYLYLEKLHER